MYSNGGMELSYGLEPFDIARTVSLGRRKRERENATRRSPWEVNKPRKLSGVYYTHNVRLSETLVEFLYRRKVSMNEPIGSVAERLINKLIHFENQQIQSNIQ